MLYQAHRGVQKEYPENTMAAIRAAKEQGYDIIEIDPAVTKDGVIVLMHYRLLYNFPNPRDSCAFRMTSSSLKNQYHFDVEHLLH